MALEFPKDYETRGERQEFTDPRAADVSACLAQIGAQSQSHWGATEAQEGAYQKLTELVQAHPSIANEVSRALTKGGDIELLVKGYEYLDRPPALLQDGDVQSMRACLNFIGASERSDFQGVHEKEYQGLRELLEKKPALAGEVLRALTSHAKPGDVLKTFSK